MNLKEILQQATEEGWATGHFNASELDQMRAIVEAKSNCVISLFLIY